MELWSAFILGFLGSAHCIGMCGPIALGLASQGTDGKTHILQGFLYNVGRILTYSVLGLLVGILGTGITHAGYQQFLSIAIGIGMLVVLLLPQASFLQSSNNPYAKFTHYITQQIGYIYNKKTYGSVFTIGLLNGFLPCGFILVGLTAAMITPTPVHSAWYMVFFGIGTFPAMFVMSMAPTFVSPSFRSKIRPFSNYFAISLALFLIYRGFVDVSAHAM